VDETFPESFQKAASRLDENPAAHFFEKQNSGVRIQKPE
jgi:hypothetical protein